MEGEVDAMKTMKTFSMLIISAALALPMVTLGAESKEKPKPYPLNTCIVTDEKLGEDPSMKPYAFVEDGQEIKLSRSYRDRVDQLLQRR